MGALRRSAVMQRYCPLNSSIALKGELPREERDGRVQSPAGKQHQRETGPGLLIVDANGAFFVELAGSSFARLLSKYAWHRGHRRCRGAGFQYVASCRIIHVAGSRPTARIE